MRAYWFDNVPVSLVASPYNPTAPQCRHEGENSQISSLQGDQRLPHDSGKAVGAEELNNLGVLYFRMPDLEDVNALAAERGYRNRDEITVSPEKMGAVYEDKVKSFFHEHLHEDEEIRYIRGGQGYFDVRDKGDQWVRIQLEKVRSLALCSAAWRVARQG